VNHRAARESDSNQGAREEWNGEKTLMASPRNIACQPDILKVFVKAAENEMRGKKE
jgi:hypothetical protein